MGKKAVVLSGGGAKGGYQIGAWTALRKIGFYPEIVTGTSVGALNGALMALDKYEDALNIWQNMRVKVIPLSSSRSMKHQQVFITILTWWAISANVTTAS